MRVTSTTAAAPSSISTAFHLPDVAFRVACHSGRQTSCRGSCTQPLPPTWRTEAKGQLAGGGALPDAVQPRSWSAENAQFIPGSFRLVWRMEMEAGIEIDARPSDCIAMATAQRGRFGGLKSKSVDFSFAIYTTLFYNVIRMSYN